MTDVNQLISEQLDIWTSAVEKKSNAGRGNGGGASLYGIKKLRELILELAARGKLVPQSEEYGRASDILESIDLRRRSLISKKRLRNQKRAGPVSLDEERFVAPPSWVWTRLSELAEISPKNDSIDTKAASFVPMPEVSTSHTGEHGQEERTWGTIKKGYTHFADGDIALAKITPCFENSKAAIFKGLTNGIGAGTTELHVARLLSDAVVARFVLLHLKAPSYLANGKPVMTGSAGQKRVPRWYFADTPIALPPTEEQHHIVAKVDELMALCDALERQTEDSLKAHQTLVETCLATLTNSETPEELTQNWNRINAHFDTLFATEDSVKSLKDAILHWSVLGLLSVREASDTNPEEFLVQNASRRKKQYQVTKDARLKKCQETLKKEYKFPLPESWELASFDELFLFIDYRGRTPKKTPDGTPLITAKNVRMGLLKREPREFVSDETYVEWMTRGFPQVGDLFFTTEAPLANICINNIEEPFAIAQRVICFQPISEIDTRFLEIAIRSYPVQEMIDRHGTGMTAKGIKASKLKPLPLPFPPLQEQLRIVSKVEELMAICDQLLEAIPRSNTMSVELANTLTSKIH